MPADAALFRGGPLHGQVRAVEDDRTEFHVPQIDPDVMRSMQHGSPLSLDAPVTFRTFRYVRTLVKTADGVVIFQCADAPEPLASSPEEGT